MGYDFYVSTRAARAGAVLRLVPGGATSPTPAAPPPAPPKPALDDVELLAALRSGDRGAAHALHRRLRPVVDRCIVRLLGRRDREHEDLVQASLMELLRSIDRFRGECSLDTWVSRITAHTVFKELRRRKTHLRFFDPSSCVEGACSSDVEREAEARGLIGRVRAHLAELDPLKAWTLLLHDVCGHDLREIAEITDASVAAAQSRLVRGRRELHERIAADPELASQLPGAGRDR
jgi:RNA polymerase sigma-70 factor (ECF subfamily)